MRERLLEKAEGALGERGYETFRYRASCVDLGARGGKSFVIKVLENIDGLAEGPAKDLARLGGCLDSEPVVLGETTKAERMGDGVVYRRHELPALTLGTFESVLDGDSMLHEYSRGRELVDVDGAALKKAREAVGLSMQALADAVGVAKESIYFYESGRMRARAKIAESISKIIRRDISRKMPLARRTAPEERAGSEIQRKLEELEFDIYCFSRFGISTGAAHRKERILLNERACGRDRLERMQRFSEFFDSFFATVSEKSVRSVPTVRKESILSAESKGELLRLLR